MRCAVLSLLASYAAADTTVAVLEVGKGGVVWRTTTKDISSSASAVSSFWNKLHDVDGTAGRRRMKANQHPSMSIVPDLFKKPNGGIVIGLSGKGLDLAAMPSVSGIVEGESGTVGHFSLSGAQQDTLLNKASSSLDTVEDSDLYSRSLALTTEALKEGNKLAAVSLKVETDDAAGKADMAIADVLRSLRATTEADGSTVVVHLVVEEEDGAMRRRLTARQLGPGDEEEEEEEEAEEVYEQSNTMYQANQQQNNFYGYGYYNDYGEWISNYKTIFQIQYFNIVLWTSLGLTVILMMSTYHMMYMPLMSDTLLFGESAKMMGS